MGNFVHVPGELDYILTLPSLSIDYQDPDSNFGDSLGTQPFRLTLNKKRYSRGFTSSLRDPLVHQTEEYWGNVNPVGPRDTMKQRFMEAMTMAYTLRQKHASCTSTYGPRCD